MNPRFFKRGSGKRWNRTASKQFPFPGIMADGKTRHYRTADDAARAVRDSRYHAEQERNKTDRVIRTKITRYKGSAKQQFKFYNQVNTNEQDFLEYADRNGLKVGRNGWPDFFCKSPSGGHAGVEVKAGNDGLSLDQMRCFAFLESVGVPVFIFHRKWSKDKAAPTLIPWREYVVHVRDTDWPEMDSGGKAARRSNTSGKQGLEVSPPHEDLASDERNPGVLGDPPTLH